MAVPLGEGDLELTNETGFATRHPHFVQHDGPTNLAVGVTSPDRL